MGRKRGGESVRPRWLLLSIKYRDHLTHLSGCRNRPSSCLGLLYSGYNILQGSSQLWKGILVASGQCPPRDHFLAFQQHDGTLSSKDCLYHSAGDRYEGWAAQGSTQGLGKLGIGSCRCWSHSIQDSLDVVCFKGMIQNSCQVTNVYPGEELVT